MSTTAYTVCLLKESISSFDEALDPDKDVDAYELNDASGLSGTLFVGRQTQSTPAWVSLLNPYLENPVPGAFTASISAVLVVEYENRFFAVCFGHGKSLLAASSWIRDFGLKVALNRVDPAKLRSIDTKTYEDLVVSTRQQVSKSSGVNSFQLDVARDLMRGVTGQSGDPTFFKRLTGSDSIHLTTELPFTDFGDLLDELLAAYSDDVYKANFEWIDNITEVDPILRQELDELLVDAIRAGNLERMHLAPADLVDWDQIEGFNYPGGGKALHYLELDLDNYVGVLGDEVEDLTIERLKHHKVRVRYEGSDEFREPWSIYDCLVWETNHNGHKYVLFDGRWFEIEANYAARVEAYVHDLSGVAVPLPDAANGMTEGEYNEAVAQGAPNTFALLDRQTVRAARAASPIEFCDLLSNGRKIVHVKKRSSSATLSHLFSQGSVSSDAFMQDREMRKEVRQKLRQAGKNAHAALIPLGRPSAPDFDIVFVILAEDKGNWPPPLPFFSAVNLMHHAGRIRNLGFHVSLQHVRQV